MPGMSRAGLSGVTYNDSVSIRLAQATGASVEQRPFRGNTPVADVGEGAYAAAGGGVEDTIPESSEQVWGYEGGERKPYREPAIGLSDTRPEESFPVEGA
jgi:hypothetical protein